VLKAQRSGSLTSGGGAGRALKEERYEPIPEDDLDGHNPGVFDRRYERRRPAELCSIAHSDRIRPRSRGVAPTVIAGGGGGQHFKGIVAPWLYFSQIYF